PGKRATKDKAPKGRQNVWMRPGSVAPSGLGFITVRAPRADALGYYLSPLRGDSTPPLAPSSRRGHRRRLVQELLGRPAAGDDDERPARPVGVAAHDHRAAALLHRLVVQLAQVCERRLADGVDAGRRLAAHQD